jgi:hypothetical protein
MSDNDNELRVKLRSQMMRTVKVAAPSLQGDHYDSFVERLVDNLIEKLHAYSKAGNKVKAQEIYRFAEKQLFTDYAQVIPEATGRSQISKDLLRRHLNGLILYTDTDFTYSDQTRGILLVAFEKAADLYAAFSKIGHKEDAEELYEKSEDQILRIFKGGLLSSTHVRTQIQLRDSINLALDAADLRLIDYEKARVQDQMLLIFSSYLEASEQEKDSVYSLGEERVLFSLFGPARGRRNEVTKTKGIGA